MLSQRDLIAEARDALKAAPVSKPRAIVGFDGFIDEIARIVDRRTDHETWTPIKTITDYAVRLAEAAGKSTNVELVVEQVKMGGNGPLLSDALGRLGTNVTSIGAFGTPDLNAAFESLRSHGEIVSVANPAVTLAAEFDDGKIMHGKLQTLDDITFEAIVSCLGGIEALDEKLSDVDLLAMVNWTMIPHLTSVWKSLRERAVSLGDGSPRLFFFDLCDPQKRGPGALREALQVITTFNDSVGTPILGLNEKESAEVCEAMGIPVGESNMDGLGARVERIRKSTGISEVVIHPHRFAVASGPGGTGETEGPYCPSPKLTTGAGDHFNGGYCYARLAGLVPRHAVVIGKCVSGFYVRNGRGPSTGEVLEFASRWIAGTLDPWEQGGTGR